jgi:hypothetical protein
MHTNTGHATAPKPDECVHQASRLYFLPEEQHVLILQEEVKKLHIDVHMTQT